MSTSPPPPDDPHRGPGGTVPPAPGSPPPPAGGAAPAAYGSTPPPPGGSAPPPYGSAPPPAGGGGGSKKGLFIGLGIGAVVLIAAVVVTLVLVLGGGDDSDDDGDGNGGGGGTTSEPGDTRPSIDDLAAALIAEDTAGELDPSMAQCVAEVMHGSNISDEALQAAVDGNDAYQLDATDEAAFSEIEDEFFACIFGGLDIPDLEMPELDLPE